ncbi:hypothetical protein [Piscirickettsia litoralis]|uniref:Uncharacterized protein n=1 Tax=Piscirickettsia litoralis TaxID=1891921 RepID=A0ABX3A1S5_9GAMM|nr:hypothetical protein [Piscirickettsia litoralis]ODN41395.1 hypothetical protein BGC07_16640 [Piscirickettsia litoralis]
MHIKQTLISVIVSSIIATIVVFLFFHNKISHLENQLAQTPPIAVVDLTQFVQSYPKGASEQTVNARLNKLHSDIAKLKDAGYLVLNANQVMAAPSDIYIEGHDL